MCKEKTVENIIVIMHGSLQTMIKTLAKNNPIRLLQLHKTPFESKNILTTNQS